MEKIEVNVYPDADSPKLFKNKVLEALTKTHPLVIDAMYLIISYFSIAHYAKTYNGSATHIVGLFAIGFLSWSLAEYLMHRFLYHKISDATYNTGIQYLFHGIHHQYPNDKARLVLPVIPSIIIASLFFGGFYLFFQEKAFVLAPAMVLGYCAYMTVHYTVHKVAPPKRFNFWWTHHNIHHYQQHDRAFGVTSPLWDIIFRTMPEKGRKTVDIKMMKNDHHHH